MYKYEYAQIFIKLSNSWQHYAKSKLLNLLFISLGSHWQLHAHYYPPLLRSATVRFSDYFQMGGNLKHLQMATILNHNTVNFEYCELNIASNLSVKLFDIYNQAKKLSESSNHVFSCGLIGRTILKQLRELIVILSYYYFSGEEIHGWLWNVSSMPKRLDSRAGTLIIVSCLSLGKISWLPEMTLQNNNDCFLTLLA